MRRTLMLTLCLATSVAACGRQAPPPPARTSPALTLVDDDVNVRAFDPRSGAVLIATEGFDEALARVDGTTLATISPPLPAPGSWQQVTMRVFADGAWVGDGFNLAELRAGEWRTWEAADCDPDALASLWFLDARSPDDVWAQPNPSPDVPVLCHFDGTSWTAETLPMDVFALVVVGESFVALGGEPTAVMRRPIAGGGWTVVEVEGNVVAIEAAGDGALLDVRDGPARRVLVTETGVETLDDDTFVGLGAERWAIESSNGAGESCGIGIWGPPCYATVDWVQYVLFELTGSAREERGHVNVFASDVGDGAALSLTLIPIAPGRVAATAGSRLYAMP